MSITVDTHLFGSRRGYESLARSSGVTATEDRALSEFGFGQSSDERFLHGLSQRPTAYGRPLPGGRVGVTRVLAGPLDDGGRPTLERRTIVVSSHQYRALRIGLEELLADHRLWSSEAFAKGAPITLLGPGGRVAEPSELHWRIFDTWVFAMTRKPHGVVVGSDEPSATAVLAVAGQVADADAADFSWGVRLLSPIAWVDVLTLSPYGVMDGRRPVFGVSERGFVNELVDRAHGRNSASLPPTSALVEIETAMEEPNLPWHRAPAVPKGSTKRYESSSSRRSKLLVAAGIVLTGGVCLSATLYLLPRSRPTVQSLPPIDAPKEAPPTQGPPSPGSTNPQAPSPAGESGQLNDAASGAQAGPPAPAAVPPAPSETGESAASSGSGATPETPERTPEVTPTKQYPDDQEGGAGTDAPSVEPAAVLPKIPSLKLGSDYLENVSHARQYASAWHNQVSVLQADIRKYKVDMQTSKITNKPLDTLKAELREKLDQFSVWVRGLRFCSDLLEKPTPSASPLDWKKELQDSIKEIRSTSNLGSEDSFGKRSKALRLLIKAVANAEIFHCLSVPALATLSQDVREIEVGTGNGSRELQDAKDTLLSADLESAKLLEKAGEMKGKQLDVRVISLRTISYELALGNEFPKLKNNALPLPDLFDALVEVCRRGKDGQSLPFENPTDEDTIRKFGALLRTPPEEPK